MKEENQLTIGGYKHLFMNSILFIYLYVYAMPVPHYLSYYNFVAALKLGKCNPPTLFLF